MRRRCTSSTSSAQGVVSAVVGFFCGEGEGLDLGLAWRTEILHPPMLSMLCMPLMPLMSAVPVPEGVAPVVGLPMSMVMCEWSIVIDMVAVFV